MARPILPDEVWRLVAPLLPPPPPRVPRLGGRTRLSSRRCLTGILYVLRSGIPWEEIPAEMGCGSGMTCWRRLQEWRDAGAWEAVRGVLVSHLPGGGELDWDRVEKRRAAPGSLRVVRPGIHSSNTGAEAC